MATSFVDTYLANHPIVAKATFPVRHPIMATEKGVDLAMHPQRTLQAAADKFGEMGLTAEKKGYTAGFSLLGAVGSTATAVIVGVKNVK